MTKVIEAEKFIVRIHGEVNKEKILEACKIYAQKVNLKGGTNEKVKNS